MKLELGALVPYFLTLLVNHAYSTPSTVQLQGFDGSQIRKREPTPLGTIEPFPECEWKYRIDRWKYENPAADYHSFDVRIVATEFSVAPQAACDAETLLASFRSFCAKDGPEVVFREGYPRLYKGACIMAVSLTYKRPLKAPLVDTRDTGVGPKCLSSALVCDDPGFVDVPWDCVRAPQSRHDRGEIADQR